MRRVQVALLLALTAPSIARAYSDGTSFARDPSADTTGGGGGIYFTGSPRQHGLDCAVCHVGGPTDIELELSALLEGAPEDLFANGYQPGGLYEIAVAFTEDRLGPAAGCQGKDDEPCDINAFTVELLDASARPAGTLCPEAMVGDGCGGCRNRRTQGTLTDSECSVIASDAFDGVSYRWRNGVTTYSFFWRAPAEPVGPVTVYVAGVDGRGQESEDGEITSYGNDGVVTAKVTIGGAAPSCRTGPGGVSAALLLLGLGLLRGRRRPAPRARSGRPAASSRG